MTSGPNTELPIVRVATVSPSAVNGSGTAPESGEVECAACGHSGPPRGKGKCERCGAFLARNGAAMIHGGRRERPLANPEHSELFQAWAADLGGDAELTAGQRAVLRRVTEADAVCQSALDYVLNSRESLVAERVLKALSVLATHTQSLYRGAVLLGLERRARAVPTLAEYMRQREAEEGAP